MMVMQLIILHVILLIPLVNGEKKDTCSAFYTQSSFRLSGHVLKQISTTTGSQCKDECKLNAKCHSINYNHGNKVCELNGANHLTNPESLLPANGYEYVNYHYRSPANCSTKLCSWGKNFKCLIDSDGQDYKCLSCQDEARQQVLMFPRRGSISDIVVLEPTFQGLTAFSLSLWVKAVESINAIGLFSYAVSGSYNEIFLAMRKADIQVFLRSPAMTIPRTQDSKWHHYGITWENGNGRMKAYIDGVLKGDTLYQAGRVIAKPGAIVLGNDQDSYLGGFIPNAAFQGEMSNVNMWDRVLTAEEISAQSKSCTIGEGNIVKWSDLMYNGRGQTSLVCSDACVSIP